MSLLIRPGISVLIDDITDLDPNVNLLLGATLFYSAYPAAEGKAGIYTQWAGEGGAEQAIKGIPHGMAPRSPTWRQAVDVFKDRYYKFNPPGAGVTSVLMVPDTDTDSNRSHPQRPTSTAINRGSTQVDKTGLGDLMELLNTLPTHVLDSAWRNRPATSLVPSSTITSAQRPQPAKPCVKSSASITVARGSVTTKAPNDVAFAHGEASNNTTTASPHTTIARMESTTTAAASPLPSTPVKWKTSTGGSNANTPDSSRPSAALRTPSAVCASTPGSQARIDSPLRGIGFAAFAAPKECYVLGYWTKTVLEFVHCDREVIPIIKSRLVHFAYDEDDVELQASLAEELTVELSHFVVNLLKLDAFLKSVGRYA